MKKSLLTKVMALAMTAVMLFSFPNRSHLSGHGYESPKWNKIS